MSDAFQLDEDIAIVKENLQNNQIRRTGMEIFIGFYSTVDDLSFDLYVEEKYYASYLLKKGFTPINIHNNNNIVIPLLNLPYMKNTYILNNQNTIFDSEIYLIGAVFKYGTYRKELQKKKFCTTLLEIEIEK